jgi:hypothetical protein
MHITDHSNSQYTLSCGHRPAPSPTPSHNFSPTFNEYLNNRYARSLPSFFTLTKQQASLLDPSRLPLRTLTSRIVFTVLMMKLVFDFIHPILYLIDILDRHDGTSTFNLIPLLYPG